MIKSAVQCQVHELLSHQKELFYEIPAYQREYAWTKTQWEHLVEDLDENEGSHFLGTIITLNNTVNAIQGQKLEVVDGQQRLTTLTLLLAAIYSVLAEHLDELDEDERTDVNNLKRMLVSKDGRLRITPQEQGHNLDDFRRVLQDAGLPIQGEKRRHFGLRRIAKCYEFFRSAIVELAESKRKTPVEAAKDLQQAVLQAVIVNIEVASYADAFVLFESLNNRGMPLTPVDLIKNRLLAESERRASLPAEDAVERWGEMLANLGDEYKTHERFLRYFYNAFRSELPPVSQATEATKSNLIRIYETLLLEDLRGTLDALVAASEVYGRIGGYSVSDAPTELDAGFQRLSRARGATSWVLLLWLMTHRDRLELTDEQLLEITDVLVAFFVRRHLTGTPPTYELARLFASTIESLQEARGAEVVRIVRERLDAVAASDDLFRQRLLGTIYEDNKDVARFVLKTLASDAMTRETRVDLWEQEEGRFVWTIEHILPQGDNLPAGWVEMLGGPGVAARVHEDHRHQLGNLTITAFNSNLGNKSFAEKRDRTDAKGRFIGYRNGLALNADLANRDTWTAEDIDRRTQLLADRVLERFPRPGAGL